jgi:fibronectin-binding autotransporter adhesin
MRVQLHRLAFAGVFAAVLFASHSGQSAQLFWSGGGSWDTTSTDWGLASGGPYNTSSWVGNSDAVFQGTAGAVSVATNIPSVNSMTFTTDGYSFSGGTISMTATGGGTFTTSGGSDTISSVIGGNGGLTKSGAGTLTFTAANIFSGITTINQGTVSISADSNLGPAPGSVSANQLTLNGGRLYVTGGGMTLSGNRGITLGSSGGTLDDSSLSNSNNLNLSSIIAGNGPLTLNANGDTSVTGGAVGGNLGLTNASNTFQGAVTINSGVVNYQADGSWGNSANVITIKGGGIVATSNNTLNHNITLANAGNNLIFRVYGNDLETINGNITGSGNVYHTDGGTLALAGNNSFAGNLEEANGNTTALGGTNSFTGATWMNTNGKIVVTANNATSPASIVLMYGNTLFSVNSKSGTINGLTSGSSSDTTGVVNLGSGGGTLTVAGNGLPSGLTGGISNASVYGQITGTGGIVYNNSSSPQGQWDWYNTSNNFAGNITITAGRLRPAVATSGSDALALGNSNNGIIFNGTPTSSLALGAGNASLQVLNGVSATFPATRTITLNSGKEGTMYVWSGTTYNILGQITGGGSLRKEDMGTLLLSNTNNNYGGNTTIVYGTLQLGGSQVIPSTSVVTVGTTTAGSNPLLDLNGKNDAVAGLSGGGQTDGYVANNAASTAATLTLSLPSASAQSFGGLIQNNTGSGGSLALVINGNGVQAITGTNNYSGGTTVSGGTLILAGANDGTSRLGSGLLTINAGATVISGADNVLGYDNNSVTPSVTVSGGLWNCQTYAASFGTLTMNGGTLARSANFWYFNQPGSISASGVSQLISGGTMQLRPAGGANMPVNVASGSTLTITSVLNNDSGASGLSLTGSGTLVFAAVNTYTGSTLVNGGTLQLGNGGLSGTAGAGPVSVAAGAALVITRSDAQTASGEFTLANNISGSGSLTANGGGCVVLSGANTYTGITTISNGSSISMSNVNAELGPTPGSFVANQLTFTGSGGALLNMGSGFPSGNNLTIDANRGIFIAAGATATFRTGYSGVNITINSVISGSGGIAKTDTTTDSLILNAANTFSGTTSWNTVGGQNENGWIQLGNGLALQNSTVNENYTQANQASGLTFTAGIGSFTLGGLSGSSNQGTSDLNSLGVTLNVGNNNASTTYSGVLSGAGSLVKIGGGQLALGGSNTYSGGTRVSSGTLQLGNNAALGAVTGSLTANGGVLDLNGYSSTVGGLSGAAGTILTSSAASTLTVNGSPAGSTYNGVLANGAGTLALTMAGTGTQYLTGANSYSGPTNINAGTLVVAGTHSGAGAYTVAGGATLAGRGLITGGALVTVNSGATVTPDNSIATGAIGTLTLPNATFNNGSLLALDLSGTATSNGGVSDLIAVTGNLALTGTTTINVNKINSSLGNGSYTLFTFGSLSSYSTSSLALAPGVLSTRQNASFTYNTVSDLISLNVNGNAANLTWVGDGAGNAWSTATSNTVWNDGTGANYFSPGDLVTFNGTSGNTTVSLSGALTPGSVTVTGTNNYRFTGPGSISGVTALTVAGPGSLTLATTGNNYTLGTNVTGGTLALGVSNALPPSGTLTLGTSGSAGTFDMAGFSQQLGGLAVGAGATAASQVIGNSIPASVSTLTFNGAAASNFAGTIQDGFNGSGGQVALNVAGGLLALSGNNTYSGTTTVSGGTLQLGSSTALYSGASAGNLAVASGALDLAGYNASVGGVSGTGTITNSAAGPGALTIGVNGSTNTFSGAVLATAGTLNLVMSGSGVETLNGTFAGQHGAVATASVTAGLLALTGSGISYTGPTTVGAPSGSGTLSVQDTTAFASAVAVGPAGTLNIDRTVAGFANRSPIAGSAITGSGVINVNNASGGLTGGWSTMLGASAMNFTGTININSGVFATDSAGGVRGSATVNIAPGAVMALHSAANGWVIGGLNGSGDVTTAQSGSPTYNLTLGAGNASGYYNGVIHGNNSVTTDGTIEAGYLSLTKIGSGTQVLNGVNNYTGATTASGGVLQLGPAGSFAAGTSLNVTGGTIDLAGQSQSVALIGGNSGTITNSSANAVQLTVNVGNGVNGNFGGSLSSPAATLNLVFNFSSTGGDTMFGFNSAVANSFSGGITINGTGGAINAGTGTDNTGIVGIAADSVLGVPTNGITLNNGATIFNGQTTNNGGGWTNNGDPNLAASRTITLGTGLGGVFRTWGGTNFTINSLISGTGGFTKVDSGTLVLTASNNYTAPTVIDNGYISVGNDYALSTGTVVVNGGGLDSTGSANYLANNNPVVLNADFTFVGSHNLDLGSGPVTLNGNWTMTISAGTLTVDGPVSSTGGTSSLTKAGGGTLVLTNSGNTFPSVNDNAGCLTIGNNQALGSGSLVMGGGSLDSTADAIALANNNPIAVNSNFTFLGTHNLNLGVGPVTLSADRTLTVNANTLTIGGPISGVGAGAPFSLTKMGAGTLVLAGGPTVLNYLSANGGTLAVQGNASATLAGELDVNAAYLQSGGVVTASARLRQYGNTSFVMTGGTATFNANDNTLNDTNAAGSSVVDLSGSSVLNFSGAVTLATFAGNTTTVHGNATLNANGGLYWGWVQGGTSVVPSSTITLNVQDAAAVNVSNTFNVSNFNNNANAGGTVINLGNGTASTATLSTVAFTRNDTNAAYTVALNFNGGALRASGIGSGSATDFLNGVDSVVIEDAGGRIDTSGLTITVPETISHAGVAATDGGLTKTGAGTLILTAANSYNGGATVNNGTLLLGNSAALGSGRLTVNQGSVDLNGLSPTVAGLAGASGIVTNGDSFLATLTVNPAAGTLYSGSTTFGGTINDGSGEVSLVMQGAGTQVLSGTNTYSGPTSVFSGTLKAGAANAFSPNSDVTADSGGTLDATAGPQAISSLAVGATGTLNLYVGNVLTCSSTAGFTTGSTLNLLGAVTSLPETLIGYSGNASGAFSSLTLNGAALPTSDLTYNFGALELSGTVSGQPAWNAGSDNWSVGTNWTTNAAPNGPSRTALLNQITSGAVAITLDVPVTLGALTMGNSAAGATSYTVSGASTLTFNNSTGTSTLTVPGASHTISAAVAITGGSLDVVMSGGGSLTIAGNISDDNQAESLILDGDGTGQLVLSGVNTYGNNGGGTVVNAGTLIVDSTTALPDGSSLTVGLGASSLFSPAAAGPMLVGEVAAVPEPGTLLLLAFGLVAVAACRRLAMRLGSI